jgi:uncharacterized caspase-like protein
VKLVRSAGLLKARLVAEDAAVQLRRADENHGKAVALVERQLNAPRWMKDESIGKCIQSDEV